MDRFAQRLLRGASLPHRLADLPDPPAEAWLAGALPRFPGVGVVGTRHPTPEAEAFAFALARDLSLQGALVVSGGAAGIDAAAHRGALAAGGPSLVVAPAGLERPYPEQNTELFTNVIAAGGGYLSLRAPHEAARLSSFFERNSVLVALCEVVVVVQAPLRSGARNAAAAARKLGRPLCVVPAAPWEPTGRGCIVELRLGAIAIDGARHVVELLSARGALLLPRHQQRMLSEHPRASWETDSGALAPTESPSDARGSGGQLTLFGGVAGASEQAIVSAIRNGCRSIDAIAEHTGQAIQGVQSSLLGLELAGAVVREAALGYRIAR